MGVIRTDSVEFDHVADVANDSNLNSAAIKIGRVFLQNVDLLNSLGLASTWAVILLSGLRFFTYHRLVRGVKRHVLSNAHHHGLCMSVTADNFSVSVIDTVF